MDDVSGDGRRDVLGISQCFVFSHGLMANNNKKPQIAMQNN